MFANQSCIKRNHPRHSASFIVSRTSSSRDCLSSSQSEQLSIQAAEYTRQVPGYGQAHITTLHRSLTSAHHHRTARSHQCCAVSARYLHRRAETRHISARPYISSDHTGAPRCPLDVQESSLKLGACHTLGARLYTAVASLANQRGPRSSPTTV